jgi:hypothetical protein
MSPSRITPRSIAQSGRGPSWPAQEVVESRSCTARSRGSVRRSKRICSRPRLGERAQRGGSAPGSACVLRRRGRRTPPRRGSNRIDSPGRRRRQPRSFARAQPRR